MQKLFKALRTRLTDGPLNLIVPISDITSSYNEEAADYPAICIGIEDGGSMNEISGVTRATVSIEIYSNVNLQQCHTINGLVKGLLHNQERATTTADRLIHLIREIKTEDRWNARNLAWRLVTTYEVIFSTSAVVATVNADGNIYVDITNVTAVAGKLIGTFAGKLSLRVLFSSESQTEGERFEKDRYFYGGAVEITIEKITFRAAALNLLWGITYNATDTLADDTTAATSYLITQASIPRDLQFLFAMTKTDDGKKMEIEADKAVFPDLQIGFTRDDLVCYDVKCLCLGDAADSVVKISVAS